MNLKPYKSKKENIMKKVGIILLIAVAEIVFLGVAGGTFPY
jgi:hypothetical protein